MDRTSIQTLFRITVTDEVLDSCLNIPALEGQQQLRMRVPRRDMDLQ